jgi:hypothetical protein
LLIAKCRNRTNDGPDCRKPRDMGAVEIAMRLAGQRKTEHIFEPVLGMVFDSKEEAYEFYNMYSWEFGFGIVKGRCVRRQKDPEYRSMQELCCERSVSNVIHLGKALVDKLKSIKTSILKSILNYCRVVTQGLLVQQRK